MTDQQLQDSSQSIDERIPFITMMKYNEYSEKFVKRFPVCSKLIHRLPLHIYEDFVDGASRTFRREMKRAREPLYIVAAMLYMIILLVALSITVASAFVIGPGAWIIFGSKSDPKFQGPQGKRYPTITWGFYLVFPLSILGFFVLKLLVVDSLTRLARHRMYARAARCVKRKLRQMTRRNMSFVRSTEIIWDFEYMVTPEMKEYYSPLTTSTLRYWFSSEPHEDIANQIVLADAGTIINNRPFTKSLSQYYPVLKLIDLHEMNHAVSTILEAHKHQGHPLTLEELVNQLEKRNDLSEVNHFGSLVFNYSTFKFVDHGIYPEDQSTTDSQHHLIQDQIHEYAEVTDQQNLMELYLGTLDVINSGMTNRLVPALKYRIISIASMVSMALFVVMILVCSGVVYHWVPWVLYTTLSLSTIIVAVTVLFVPYKLHQRFLQAFERSITDLQNTLTIANVKVFSQHGIEWIVENGAPGNMRGNYYGFLSYPMPSTPVINLRSIPHCYTINRPVLIIDTGTKASECIPEETPERKVNVKTSLLNSPVNVA